MLQQNANSQTPSSPMGGALIFIYLFECGAAQKLAYVCMCVCVSVHVQNIPRPLMRRLEMDSIHTHTYIYVDVSIYTI